MWLQWSSGRASSLTGPAVRMNQIYAMRGRGLKYQPGRTVLFCFHYTLLGFISKDCSLNNDSCSQCPSLVPFFRRQVVFTRMHAGHPAGKRGSSLHSMGACAMPRRLMMSPSHPAQMPDPFQRRDENTTVVPPLPPPPPLGRKRNA